jgi:GNAT superfamily N-acetyltransferase
VLVKEAPQLSRQDWQDARQFCLQTIKEVYGIDYTSEWHQDLDWMITPANVYLPANGGWFLFVRNEKSEVVACAGLRGLATRPNLLELFKHRWPNPHEVGALWRSYVRADYRGQGIGRMMKRRRISKAKQLGYEYLYLHASNANPVAIRFGEKFGFRAFKEDEDGTVHMEVKLGDD